MLSASLNKIFLSLSFLKKKNLFVCFCLMCVCVFGWFLFIYFLIFFYIQHAIYSGTFILSFIRSFTFGENDIIYTVILTQIILNL